MVQGSDEFESKIKQYKEIFEKEMEENIERYNRIENGFNNLMKRLKELIDRKKQSSATFEEHEDPPKIDVIKKLLEKLKSLIPKTGELKDLLDKILKNLNPQRPQEFSRLLSYIEEVYEPALKSLLVKRLLEMKIEAYENFARAILKELINEELKKLEGEGQRPSSS